ncbi:hypothetical protein [Oscillibacter sp.]|uniref:hypothetical protein n=1 Tax=Oscillibacter sp. TaxID=1945593 RepID=UPI0028990874|nr:hypothetical protein [Oscillibacter sp.]
MSDNAKAKVGIHMKPDLIAGVDAEYPLYDYPSRSAFVGAATELYFGYLHSQSDTDYMNKTTLAFLENQVTRLDAKVCRQLFRLCVELSMVAHVTAATVHGNWLDGQRDRTENRAGSTGRFTRGRVKLQRQTAETHCLPIHTAPLHHGLENVPMTPWGKRSCVFLSMLKSGMIDASFPIIYADNRNFPQEERR